ncbi:MFS general substrate transporter [Penicillium capsulatum]|uniref:MFS general substrate transporter n=1 Tax=Penicillium capsulatum TaxID=69766 RepID=A0A9W9IRQ7_9EURO|nr:MFS general substrate transporter [Penicillium capsulatum]KAJ6130262.1 MFS general substrate transporter [Penicillium capsulatum]
MGLALWALPRTIDTVPIDRAFVTRLVQEVDWIGALLISASFALLSYAPAIEYRIDMRSYRLNTRVRIVDASAGLSRSPIVDSGLHVVQPTFQGNLRATDFLIWGTLNASEQLTALYLRDVREVFAFTSSLYFLPAPVYGLLMNIAIGAFIPYLRSSAAVPIGCLVSGIASLLLAVLCHRDGPGYWRGIFQAMALNPLGVDVIYTFANLVMTSAFPNKTQALAGGVFNMLAQIGKSVRIATSALVARQITAQSNGNGPKEA